MTSEARARPRAEDEVDGAAVEPAATAQDTPADGGGTGGEKTTTAAGAANASGDEAERDTDDRRSRRRRRRDAAAARADEDTGGDTAADDITDDEPRSRGRMSLSVAPVLAALLVLLLAGTGFLWFTRPHASAVHTADYVQALEAARSGVVDLTSFDYVTLDEDIAQIKKIATGDLRDEAVAQLDKNRQAFTDAQAVVNTEVVAAGVTRADDSSATVMMVIQATKKSTASPQAQISQFRIEVQLKKVDGRWLLSGVTGR